MKILVTGAAGKISQEVAKKLLAHGMAVRAVGRNISKLTSLQGAETAHMDFADAASVRAALDGVNGLYLMSPQPHGPVMPHVLAMVDAAKAAGVRHIVMLSAIGVERARYGSLLQIEQHVQASGLPYTLLRPSYINQNYSMAYVNDIKRGGINFPAGLGKTAYVDGRDIGTVAALAFSDAKHIGQAYTLTGAELHDHHELAAIFTRVLGKPVTYLNPSPADYAAKMRSFGVSEVVVDMLSGIYSAVANNEVNYCTSTVKDITGHDPIPFAQFVQDYAEVWRD